MPIGLELLVFKSDAISVHRDFLKEYLENYHHQTAGRTCKADGQIWPCDVYDHLYYQVYNKTLDTARDNC